MRMVRGRWKTKEKTRRIRFRSIRLRSSRFADPQYLPVLCPCFVAISRRHSRSKRQHGVAAKKKEHRTVYGISYFIGNTFSLGH